MTVVRGDEIYRVDVDANQRKSPSDLQTMSPNQALQTTSVTLALYEKTFVFGRHRLGV